MSESVIFKASVKLPPDQRAAYLIQACGADTELRREVESLLRAHDASGSFLQDHYSGTEATEDYPPITERPGTTVGPYKLMEQIGEGGFGLVFVAEQQRPVRRKVALKIIKPGMDTRDVIARFEAERQALALMDHPNIARVLDAGATENGRPYFVMELVKGIPINEYCDQQQLTAHQRLELFLSVCHAVQHAHAKGIIHRDLKPSNILVAPHDGVPVVKVIDFGIAKAIGQQLTEKTIYTRFTQMIGTPLYMSPEQAEINALDVDIRSDVYSLGVLLYELLTGTTPFGRERLMKAAYEEIRRIIKEEEPPKPSVRLSTMGETLTKVSTQRKTEPTKLSALVKGDLDWIVMKALEKDRTRRYETASTLAADVRRFLAKEPIEARPPSTAYKLKKFVQRNRAAVLTAGAVAAALVAVVAVLSIFAVCQTRNALRLAQDAKDLREEENRTKSALDDANVQKVRADERARLAESRLAENDLDRGIALCQQGDVPRGMVWLSQSLQSAPPGEKVLEKAARANLACWQQLLSRGGAVPPQGSIAPKTVLEHQGPVLSVAFSPDGKHILTGSADKTAQLWDTASGTRVGRPIEHGGAVRAVVFSLDGRYALTGSDDGKAQVWEALTGKPAGPALIHQKEVSSVAFSPHGEYVATGCYDKRARVWATATGKQVGRSLEHRGVVMSVAFSPDGKHVLTGSDDGTARVWETLSGKPVGDVLKHHASVSSAAYSPDGKYVVTAGDDMMAQVWETAGSKPIGQAMAHRGLLSSVAFSPDGEFVLTGGWDKTARLWTTFSGKPVGPALMHGDTVESVAFSPDGRYVLTGSKDNKARLWNVSSPWSGSPERISLNVTVLAAMELDEHRTIRFLNLETLLQRQRQLEQLGGAIAP